MTKEANVKRPTNKKQKKANNKLEMSFLEKIKRDKQLLIILIPGILFYLIYRYAPMFGLITAFQKYSPFLGIFKSPWAKNYGFEHFIKFFGSNDFFALLGNTLWLGTLTLVWTFPITIIFALLLNEIRVNFLKKTFQTISYLPTFLSIVIVCSMAIDMLSPNGGIVNQVLVLFGKNPHLFITDPKWYRTIYVVTQIWASMGSGAIIYLAALSSVDTALYEAAKIDGAGRLRMIWSITLPSILPTITTMLILNSANLFRIAPDKTLLLANPFTLGVADVFGTYVYRRGIEQANFSYATAVGLFESLVSCIILVSSNKISKKVTGEGLW